MRRLIYLFDVPVLYLTIILPRPTAVSHGAMTFQSSPFTAESSAEKPLGFTFRDTRIPGTRGLLKEKDLIDAIVWVVLAVRAELYASIMSSCLYGKGYPLDEGIQIPSLSYFHTE